jgi:hypothetical protein
VAPTRESGKKSLTLRIFIILRLFCPKYINTQELLFIFDHSAGLYNDNRGHNLEQLGRGQTSVKRVEAGPSFQL